MNADGSDQTELLPAGAYDWGLQGHAEWSPDGTKIVMIGGPWGNPQIFVTDATGANPVQLTNRGGTNIDPSWAPSGNEIVFSAARRRSASQRNKRSTRAPLYRCSGRSRGSPTIPTPITTLPSHPMVRRSRGSGRFRAATGVSRSPTSGEVDTRPSSTTATSIRRQNGPAMLLDLLPSPRRRHLRRIWYLVDQSQWNRSGRSACPERDHRLRVPWDVTVFPASK
jgi:hypothetical protein